MGLKIASFGFINWYLFLIKEKLEVLEKEDVMKAGRWIIGILCLSVLGMIQLASGQEGAVTDKSQVAFHKDSLGYIYSAPGVDLKSFDTIVIGKFSIEGLPPIGPGRLEGYRDTYRNHLKTKLTAAGIFKEVTDDLSKASGPKTLVLSGDILTMHPGSTAARFVVGFGAGKAVAEIKTYLSPADDKKILLAHHLRPTSGIRGGLGEDGLAYLYQGIDRIATLCVDYIKRVY
jgi:hypothetical protein